MTAQILQFARPRTVDEAFQAYVALIHERAANHLWADIEHNKRIVRAWDEFSRLYFAEEQRT